MTAIAPASTRPPAEVYEAEFVPALFQPFSTVVADAAGITAGQRVLDVACGTGVLARTVAARVGASGAVIGLDANPEMLAVARRLDERVEWIHGRAEALPLPDASVDAVISQFGLMFFDDRVAALREMQRVLRPSGYLAVAVCDAVERSPGYGALAGLLQSLFGDRLAAAFRAPFAIGDAKLLAGLAQQAGLQRARCWAARPPCVLRRSTRWCRPSAPASGRSAWPARRCAVQRLLREARRALAPVQRDGSVAFEIPALVIARTRLTTLTKRLSVITSGAQRSRRRMRPLLLSVTT
jgi:SAM-dependent methyltransferase